MTQYTGLPEWRNSRSRAGSSEATNGHKDVGLVSLPTNKWNPLIATERHRDAIGAADHVGVNAEGIEV